jgi:hypothetical protein
MLRERGTQATAMLIMDSVLQPHVHFNNIPSLNDNDNNNNNNIDVQSCLLGYTAV